MAGFAAWLAQAQIAEAKLTAPQQGVLHAAFAFRQRCGHDSYATRLLSHFLLPADTGRQVAQSARLLHLSRPTATAPAGAAVGHPPATAPANVFPGPRDGWPSRALGRAPLFWARTQYAGAF